jgi:hypothetical protein
VSNGYMIRCMKNSLGLNRWIFHLGGLLCVTFVVILYNFCFKYASNSSTWNYYLMRLLFVSYLASSQIVWKNLWTDRFMHRLLRRKLHFTGCYLFSCVLPWHVLSEISMSNGNTIQRNYAEGICSSFFNLVPLTADLW